MVQYRIHWWYDDANWEIELADSDEARDFMEGDALVELDPELVARYRKICREYGDVCEEIGQERDRQVVFDRETRKWVPRNPS